MASSSTRKTVLGRTTDWITCRQVLNLMVILGFMFNYMLRVNLTLAIVEMVYDTDTHTIQNGSISNNETISNLTSITNASTDVVEDVTLTPGSKFHWDKYAQNYILGSFFWGYILTELPGGRLAEVIGARKVFGGGMLMASFLTLLTPPACRWGFLVVVGLRALVGFFLGATFPATPPMAAKWIPPLERSKFIANMMASSLGAALTMPLGGFLISTLGWESVFYVTGGIGLVWSIAWFFLVYDSPAQHPRISPEERYEIETKIAEGSGSGIKPSRVPWKAIFVSMPVWAIVVTHGCSVFGYFTVVNQLPTYMKEVLHFNIKKNGLLSSFPYLGKYLMAVTASYFADRLRRSGKYSTSLIRKGFTTLAVFVPGLFMIVQAIFGEDPVLSVVIFTCSLFFNGAVTGGYLTNGLDIAPNFSGTIMGMANTLSSIGGWLSTFMVATITNKNHTFEQWRYVFWILVVIYIVGSLMFAVFGTAQLQSWNSIQRAPDTITIKTQEMQPLKKKENEIKA
ncbi:hypothetical protein ILUMI_12679 [Ignelater luminosus]|uniref:Major facilitator superfamily (MFS) profile domain-containing protein n=1 Tax=Ignelater luminosus TaxID=2038154 RepID=A0A8K0CZX2_IGNLU|nr:hypothetical protein ILUMI_12679 [Ignelater luminosus]